MLPVQCVMCTASVLPVQCVLCTVSVLSVQCVLCTASVLSVQCVLGIASVLPVQYVHMLFLLDMDVLHNTHTSGLPVSRLPWSSLCL